jgi:phosphoribosylanthranilate isomerase
VTIKICGITRAEDAMAAVDLGVHALGFVLWPQSPRAITAERVQEIVEVVPPFVTPVGVFVDPSAELVAASWRAGIRVAQIVGTVPDLPDGMALLRVVNLDSPDALSGRGPILVDAHDPVRRGGTGQTIDWSAVAPLTRVRPVILAGGLHAGNVGTAIGVARPAGVDVSSGVEDRPGIKNPNKLAAFVAAVRAVA